MSGSDQSVWVDQKAAYFVFDALEWAGAQSWIEDEPEIAAEYINTLLFIQEQFTHEFLEDYHDFSLESNHEEAARFGRTFKEVSKWARENNHPLKQYVTPENSDRKDTDHDHRGDG